MAKHKKMQCKHGIVKRGRRKGHCLKAKRHHKKR